MKDTHIYQRMNNTQVMKGYINIIKTYEDDVVKQLFANITKDASDHPHYNSLKAAYEQRYGTSTKS